MKVGEVVESAREDLQLRETIKHTQTDRYDLGVTNMQWWLKGKGNA